MDASAKQIAEARQNPLRKSVSQFGAAFNCMSECAATGARTPRSPAARLR
jgi:hypothetical protein